MRYARTMAADKGHDMANETCVSGAMEGRGAYNRHSRLQASGSALALPLLERAVAAMTFESAARPIVIADYGSSQGKNSLAPISLAVGMLRKRLGQDWPLMVCHVDRPSNDFNSLFELLDTDPHRYRVDDRHVFPCAIGRSFYGSVLPSNSVDIGWSSFAAMWLSRIPALVPNHFYAFASTGTVRAAFEPQAAQDWEAFIALRAAELRPGGRLIVVAPGVHDSGTTGFEHIMNCANQVLTEMVEAGTIAADERSRMAMGVWPRSKPELLAPFCGNGRSHDLTVEDHDTWEIPDPAWIAYEQNGDLEALAMRQARFFRVIAIPTLASALTRVGVGDTEAFQTFADRLETGLKHRLAAQPRPLQATVEAIVLAKQATT
jgi:SAM dependent carboxyl methyltransferase